jgi:hypothetical protein
MVSTIDTENIYFAAIVKKNPGYSESNVLSLVLLENTDKTDPRRYEHVWKNFSVPSTASQAAVAARVLRVALQHVNPSKATTIHATVPFEPSCKDLELYPRLELEITPQNQSPAWPLLLARVSQLRGF